MILAPLGAFLTYKANNDSVVFNPEAYRRLIHRVLGLRTRRHVARKEVIVYDPDYISLYERLGILAERCREYNDKKKLWRIPNYLNHFFYPQPDHEVENINAEMEEVIEELSNSKNAKVLYELNRFPRHTFRLLPMPGSIVFREYCFLWDFSYGSECGNSA